MEQRQQFSFTISSIIETRDAGIKDLNCKYLPPANEVTGRYCFHRCLSVSHSVHGGRG